MSSEPAEPAGPSGRPRSPDPLARLADVLAEAAHGVRPTPLELAEVLWLARHIAPAADERDGTGRPGPAGEAHQGLGRLSVGEAVVQERGVA
ncbi:hypothetical protein L0F81_39640, partial [Streptomyces tricolor]